MDLFETHIIREKNMEEKETHGAAQNCCDLTKHSQKGMFDAILQPEDRTPEKNRILFMCAALIVSAVAFVTLFSFFQ
jgi:hypothetical protein